MFANTCYSAWSFKHLLYALCLEKWTLLKPWKNLLSCIHIQFKSVEYPSRHTVHSISRSYSNLQVHFWNPKFVLSGWTWQKFPRVSVKIREGTKYMTLLFQLFPFKNKNKMLLWEQPKSFSVFPSNLQNRRVCQKRWNKYSMVNVNIYCVFPQDITAFRKALLLVQVDGWDWFGLTRKVSLYSWLTWCLLISRLISSKKFSFLAIVHIFLFFFSLFMFFKGGNIYFVHCDPKQKYWHKYIFDRYNGNLLNKSELCCFKLHTVIQIYFYKEIWHLQYNTKHIFLIQYTSLNCFI